MPHESKFDGENHLGTRSQFRDTLPESRNSRWVLLCSKLTAITLAILIFAMGSVKSYKLLGQIHKQSIGQRTIGRQISLARQIEKDLLTSGNSQISRVEGTQRIKNALSEIDLAQSRIEFEPAEVGLSTAEALVSQDQVFLARSKLNAISRLAKPDSDFQLQSGTVEPLTDAYIHAMEQVSEQISIGESNAAKEFGSILCWEGISLIFLFGTVIFFRGRSTSENPPHNLSVSEETLFMDRLGIDTAVAQNAIVVVTDTHGRIAHVNARYCSVNAQDPEQAISTIHPIFVNPQTSMLVELETAGKWTGEIKNVSLTGKEYWTSTTIAKMRESGMPERYVILMSDITRLKLSEIAALERLERQRKISAHLPGFVYEFIIRPDGSGYFPYASDGIRELYGITPESLIEDGTAVLAATHPDDHDELQASVMLSAQTLQPWSHMYRIIHRDGSVRWVLGNSTPERLADGSTVWHGLISDATDVKRADEALRLSEERYALAARGANDALWDWNLANDSVYFAPRWAEMFGLATTEIGSHSGFWIGLCHPEDEELLLEAIQKCRSGETETLDIEHRLRSSDDTFRWVRARAICTRNELGRADRLVGSISDIHDRKVAEDELILAANTDKMTGLPNRSLILKKLAHANRRFTENKREQFAVLFLDFDRFKAVNDSLGHEVGDQLLQSIANRLRNCVRANTERNFERRGNIVGRLGGDEFVVILDNIKNSFEATVVADRLLRRLSEPYKLGKNVIHTSASIGIVLTSNEAANADDLLRDADTAMYEAKIGGKNRYVLFDVSMRERVQNRIAIENDLRFAVESNQLSLQYQPIVSLRTDEVVTLEALVRWHHPTRGVITPSEFIPIAEESGMILSIGEWVLGAACKQLADWKASLGSEAPRAVSVNVSRNQLQLPGFPDRVGHIVRESGLNPSDVHLEVTESAIMTEKAVAEAALKALKRQGFIIDIDDFGSGYTSLSDLDQFPLDVVKIDRNFATDLHAGSRHVDMISAMKTLARSIDAEVVAEGVETEEQFLTLLYMGIDMVQGYYVAPPLDAYEAAKFRFRSESKRYAA